MLLLMACEGKTTIIGADTGGVDVPDEVPVESAGHVEDDTGEDTEPDDTGGEDTAEEALEDAIYEAWFDRGVIHEVHLTLTSDAIADLRRDPFEWVHGDVDLDGTAFPDVGVRLKGSSSFQDFSGKPAFKIEFDQWVADQKYGSLERLVLNNMVGDYAMGREIVAYTLFQSANLPAPRITYARVFVNDELFGLYSSPEAMDNHWVRRRYDLDDRDGGDLWEGNDYCDFTRGGLQSWELAAGPGDEEALEAVKDALSSPDDFVTEVGEVVDVDEYLAFWAMTILVGNSDGYPYNLNDVYLYRDPADGKFDFSPWGLDETWPEAGFTWNSVSGKIATECLQDDPCVSALREAVDAAVVVWDQANPSAIAEEAWALTAEAAAEDPRKPYTTEDVERARATLNAMIAEWPERVQRGM
ncbi:MAG: CotH kinase family protein [Myxococcota bacterium]